MFAFLTSPFTERCLLNRGPRCGRHGDVEELAVNIWFCKCHHLLLLAKVTKEKPKISIPARNVNFITRDGKAPDAWSSGTLVGRLNRTAAR